MARRRRRGALPDTGLFDTERHAEKLDRVLDTMVGPQSRAPDRDVSDTVPSPTGVSGAGGASTGFGRRAFLGDYSRVQWDPEIPYPQVSPTPSTDRERPRTIAAGYDPGNRILRVTFREGAVYEYLDVPQQTWRSFQRNPSPGRMIDDVMNQFFYRRIE